MLITFVSNYINHHQMPFCEEMIKLCGEGNFVFIQTEAISDERRQMGWQETFPDYVRCSYINEDENRLCRKMIYDSDVVIFGGCEDRSYIEPRLEAGGKLTFIYSERLYKEALWKWISPRGLIKKIHDHTRYKNDSVYLLCAGGYVATDFGKSKSYPGKMYKWGYFPRAEIIDVEDLLSKKGWQGNAHILWTGRFLDWKHPELALEVARRLKEKGYAFHMDVVGGGHLNKEIHDLHVKYELGDFVDLHDFKSPDEIRGLMRQADIYLFTSDRNEGWGAVCNEAMNSACAVVASHMIGAVPYLITNSVNGMIYENGNFEDLMSKVELLLNDELLRKNLGREAYNTISKVWNAEFAAGRLYELIISLLSKDVASNNDASETSNLENMVKQPNTKHKCRPCDFDNPRSEAKIKRELLKR